MCRNDLLDLDSDGSYPSSAVMVLYYFHGRGSGKCVRCRMVDGEHSVLKIVIIFKLTYTYAFFRDLFVSNSTAM